MSTYIEYMDYHTPEESITISDVLEKGNLTESEYEKIAFKLLGQQREKSELIRDFEASSMMFYEERKREGDIFIDMLEELFSTNQIRPDEIGYIIYTRGNSIAMGDPWSLEDHDCINIPYYIQRKFNIKQAVAFNVEQECTGSHLATHLAKALIQTDNATKILILSSNFFELSQKRLMGGSVFVGDGQALMVVSAKPSDIEIVDYAGNTDGTISTINSFLDLKNQSLIVSTGVELVTRLVNRNHLTLTDISLFIPLNTSPFAWHNYARCLGIPLSKVYLENIGRGGHLGDVDFIRNLKDIHETGKIQKNSNLVAYGISTGTSWSAVLLKYHG